MSERILICGVNWLGDSIMTMPALQAFRKRWPASRVTMLVRRKLVNLWGMHAGVDEVLAYESTVAGTLLAARAIRSAGFERAFVFPHSFRSALIPFLGGVRRRIGIRGVWRRGLLTDGVAERGPDGHDHQLWEYYRILGLETEHAAADEPALTIPPELRAAAGRRLDPEAGAPVVGMLPGAAYGPAKRWPADHFAEAGRMLCDDAGCRLALFGTTTETGLCDEVARQIGAGAVNLAGQTSLPELAALLGACRVVIANDSGGMHLATAVGGAVVGIFGITDPTKTAPIGRQHRVICAEGVPHSRDLRRDSAEARRALRSIPPRQVADAVLEIMRPAPRENRRP